MATLSPRRSAASARRKPTRVRNESNPVSDAIPSPELVERARAILDREIDFRFHASFEKSFDLCDVDELLTEIDRCRTSTNASSDPVRASILPRALAKLCRTPLLTPEQEQRCFRLMNGLKFRANALRSAVDPSRPHEATLNTIDHLVDQARQIREWICRANLRLVVSIARTFVDPRRPLEELVSTGTSILLYAIDKFDFSRGFRFSTYATHALRREFYREVMTDSRRRQRMPALTSEMAQQVVMEQQSPRQSDERYGEVLKLMEAMQERLEAREQVILRARFGLASSEEAQTLQEVAGKLGICKERVRQIQERALDKLRDLCRELRLFQGDASALQWE